MRRTIWSCLLLLTACTSADLLRDTAARPTPGLLHAVVEIPAGTNAKWEVGLDGVIRLDRTVQYLPYPANYGIVPRAVLGTEFGGDGDPLDVVVLGPGLPRGGVVAVRSIGTIQMTDRGELDDKILAVQLDGPLSDVASVTELDRDYPGVTAILRTWFEGYKGPGKVRCRGFGTVAEADELIATCERSFASQAR